MVPPPFETPLVSESAGEIVPPCPNCADGCIAAMDIDRYLKGRNKVRVDWVHDT